MIDTALTAGIALLFAVFALIGAVTVGEYVFDRLGERRRLRRRPRLAIPVARVVDTRARLDTMRQLAPIEARATERAS